MRKLILFAAIAIFASCSSDTSPAPEPASPVVPDEMRWIPNWYPGDTLYAYVQASSGATTGELDTIYTWTSGDTTGIYYHGAKVYLWWNKMLPNITLEPDKASYGYICFNTTPFDTVGALSYGMANTVSPYRYIDSYGDERKQKQRVYFNKPGNLTVKVYNGYYESRRTY